MTDPRLAVIVLAAGQGTRMKSSRAKVLHPLAGVPLIGHVLATARELSAAHVIAVVRHEIGLVDKAPDAVHAGSVGPRQLGGITAYQLNSARQVEGHLRVPSGMIDC